MNSRKESPLVILSRALPPGVVAAMVLKVAAIVGGLMIGALALGFFLDGAFGTKPLFILALAFISLPLSVWLTYRLAMRASARASREYQAYLESKRSPPHDHPQDEGAPAEPLARAQH